jgi:hypothetical protein
VGLLAAEVGGRWVGFVVAARGDLVDVGGGRAVMNAVFSVQLDEAGDLLAPAACKTSLIVGLFAVWSLMSKRSALIGSQASASSRRSGSVGGVDCLSVIARARCRVRGSGGSAPDRVVVGRCCLARAVRGSWRRPRAG